MRTGCCRSGLHHLGATHAWVPPPAATGCRTHLGAHHLVLHTLGATALGAARAPGLPRAARFTPPGVTAPGHSPHWLAAWVPPHAPAPRARKDRRCTWRCCTHSGTPRTHGCHALGAAALERRAGAPHWVPHYWVPLHARSAALHTDLTHAHQVAARWVAAPGCAPGGATTPCVPHTVPLGAAHTWVPRTPGCRSTWVSTPLRQRHCTGVATTAWVAHWVATHGAPAPVPAAFGATLGATHWVPLPGCHCLRRTAHLGATLHLDTTRTSATLGAAHWVPHWSLDHCWVTAPGDAAALGPPNLRAPLHLELPRTRCHCTVPRHWSCHALELPPPLVPLAPGCHHTWVPHLGCHTLGAHERHWSCRTLVLHALGATGVATHTWVATALECRPARTWVPRATWCAHWVPHGAHTRVTATTGVPHTQVPPFISHT
ncbi:hypothetical protein GPJ56_004550 [Histomonas meleagridis]|nr:hypothetical protein GPJ56_004550 [Histomonas meleagridis]